MTSKPKREEEAAKRRQQQKESNNSPARRSSEMERGQATDGGGMPTALRWSIRHLRKSYVPGTPVLDDISLTIEGRGITAVIGPSGTGKSTLIRCINRLVTPTSGEIIFGGQELTKLSGRALREARRRIGMVHQEYNLVERLSVIENVLCGRLGYVPVVARLAAQIPARGYRARLRSARCGRPWRIRAAPRRSACPAVSASASASPAR